MSFGKMYVILIAAIICLAGGAIAQDYTVTVFSADSITIPDTDSTASFGGIITVVNQTGVSITVSIQQSDSKFIMDAVVIGPGGSASARVTAPGAIEVCITIAVALPCFNLYFPVPAPSLTVWGAVILIFLLMASAFYVYRRKGIPA